VIQRVLVALDDTPLSEQLLRYASAFAGAFQARVTLLRTYNWSERFAMLDTPPVDAVVHGPEQEAAAARAFLEERARPLRESGLRVEMVVVDAPTADAIIEEARRVPATLVVVGTHERGWLARLVRGSTLHEVLARFETPVLVLRDAQ
jgi:nucleotide-binding universal stress UspA family protein